MLVTAAVAVPLGVAAGVYLEEYAPKNWVTDIIEINITNLAGVPSIVYGLLALGLFVYEFGLGQSILTAGLTLALLILPVVIVATREAIRSIPGMIREGAYARRRHQVADDAGPHPALLAARHPDRRDHRHVARHRRDRADHHDRRAHLHRVPAAVAGHDRASRSCRFDWLKSPFTVMPIQMFNWTSRPTRRFTTMPPPPASILVFMTLGDERPGDLAPLSPAQEHQMVTAMEARTQTTTHATMLGSARSGATAPADSEAPRRRSRPRAATCLLLRQVPGAEGDHDAGAREPGHGADRAVGLRQVDLPALLQPHARPLSGQPLRRRDRALPGRHQPARRTTSTRSRCACASAWCSRSPIRSRSRSTRTSPTACGCAACPTGTCSTRRSSSRCAARRCGTRSRTGCTRSAPTSRADSSSACASPARSPPTRRSCCSTSRPRRSTRSRPRASRS